MSDDDASDSNEESFRALLRWPDFPGAVWQEQFVDIIEIRSSEAIISSACEIPEKTAVRLVGNGYTGNGIVLACTEHGSGYLVDIMVGERSDSQEPHAELDPGIFAVEDFFTEEDETRILDDLGTG